ncbi:MAG: hypothetical protein R2880_07010 [Deinococcales bacterium]
MKLKIISTTLVLALLLAVSLGACRNETQNLIRRQIQDFTGSTQYIAVYSMTGEVLFEGQVDGKVTRSSGKLSDGSAASSGGYIFWYDKSGFISKLIALSCYLKTLKRA